MTFGRIGTREVIPNIESDLFVGHETSHLAVGIVAIGSNAVSGLENEFKGYSLLRGNVYGRQKQYVRLDDLNADGAEIDPDDERSVHLTLIENIATSTRVVGAMRLIIKSPEYRNLLPIEAHYPEAFPTAPVPILGTEVSRLICRHEDKQTQTSLKWLLFTAGVSHAMSRGLGPVFGVIEQTLSDLLIAEGVPIHMLAPTKFVAGFNAVKAPFHLDLDRLHEKIKDDRSMLHKSMQVLNSEFVYSGAVSGQHERAMAAD